jgi:N utilization substance protein B
MNREEKRQARILALQVFFCYEQQKFVGEIKNTFAEVTSFDDLDEEQKNETFEDENGEIKEVRKVVADNPSDLSENVKKYALEIVKFTADKLETIDKKLSECTQNWALERLNTIDRNLLRISLAEMDKKFDVPKKVVINEAIEISKMFGTDDSAKFVNAVLDRIKNENTKQE